MRKFYMISLMLCISLLLYAGPQKESGVESPDTMSSPGTAGKEGLGAIKGEAIDLNIAALKGPTGIGMVRLFEATPDLGEGVNSTYELVGSPDVIVSRILSGEVDIAALPTNVAVKLYNKGVPYFLGAVVGNGLLYLISSDTEVDGFEDLRGSEVFNIGKGATPDFMLRYLLDSASIDPESDLTISFTYSHPELAQMMIAGRVQTAVLPEPFVTMVLMKNENTEIKVNLQEEWSVLKGTDGSYPMSVVVIKKEAAKKNPEAIHRFLESYRESIEWVQASPNEAGTLAEKHGIGMTAPIAVQAIPRLNLTFIPGTEARSVLEDFLQVFMDYDPAAIGGVLPDEGFYGK